MIYQRYQKIIQNNWNTGQGKYFNTHMPEYENVGNNKESKGRAKQIA